MLHKFKASSDASICILDTTGHYTRNVRQQLVYYKARFGESLADLVAVASSMEDVPQGCLLVVPEYIYQTVPHKGLYDCRTVPSIANLTHYDLRALVIDPIVHYTKGVEQARKWLQELPDLFTYDCEAAAIVKPGEEIDEGERKDRALNVRQHELTMYSFAGSESEAFVISNEGKEMQDMVMDFLVTTDKTIIMHNASFDAKIVKYLTGKHIKHIEDSQLLTWVKLNHCDTSKAKVGLKGLAGHVYSDWAVSADLFGIEHKYNPDLIRYSGIDAMATMFVYNEYKDR